jgi:hypothetical protein
MHQAEAEAEASAVAEVEASVEAEAGVEAEVQIEPGTRVGVEARSPGEGAGAEIVAETVGVEVAEEEVGAGVRGEGGLHDGVKFREMAAARHLSSTVGHNSEEEALRDGVANCRSCFRFTRAQLPELRSLAHS